MKFSIVLISFFSFSIFAETKPLSTQTAFIGKAISSGLIAGQAIMNEAARRASNWRDSLFPKSHPQAEPSAIELYRRTRALQTQLSELQKLGDEQERALVESELDTLYQLTERLINWLSRKPVQIGTIVDITPNSEQTSARTSPVQSTPSTEAVNLVPEDDENGDTESLPSAIRRSSSTASSTCLDGYFAGFEIKIREQLAHLIESVWRSCERYPVLGHTDAKHDSDSSIVAPAQSWTPEASSEPVSVADRVSGVLAEIEEFVKDSNVGEEQRFELNVPGYSPLIIWVTREEANRIRIELAAEKIASGASKTCYRSSVTTSDPNLSLVIDLGEPEKEALLIFPTSEGSQLAAAVALLKEHLPPEVFEEIRLAGLLDVSRIHNGNVEAREPLFWGSLDNLYRRLSPKQILVILQDIAQVLHELHSAGLVHRDVKPGNILVDGLRRGFLTDLSGIALYKNPAGALDVGTLGFISNLFVVSPANDIFALARIVERLLPEHLTTEVAALMNANARIPAWSEAEGRDVYETLRRSNDPVARERAYQEFCRAFPEFQAFLAAMLTKSTS